MKSEKGPDTGGATSNTDRALRRIVAEIVDGLQHGHFRFEISSEVIGQGRRRLILNAGKSYQFVIPSHECVASEHGNVGGDAGVKDS
jgi:hypothetical protein